MLDMIGCSGGIYADFWTINYSDDKYREERKMEISKIRKRAKLLFALCLITLAIYGIVSNGYAAYQQAFYGITAAILDGY